jgi:DNA-binding NarL/FixJ family response regulator
MALLQRRRRVDPLAGLTPREREVLALMAEGRSNTAIAATLVLSPRTIESHVSQIFTKLDLGEEPHRHRRVAAVLWGRDQNPARSSTPAVTPGGVAGATRLPHPQVTLTVVA